MIPRRYRTAVEFVIVMVLLFAAVFLPEIAGNVVRSLFSLPEVASHE